MVEGRAGRRQRAVVVQAVAEAVVVEQAVAAVVVLVC